MFRKLFAASLLLLALSPFTAPFQVNDAHGLALVIPSVESRTSLRVDDDSCPIAISPSVAAPSSATGCQPALLTLCTAPLNRHGDYSPSATILRL
jgi:hypothetical protein